MLHVGATEIDSVLLFLLLLFSSIIIALSLSFSPPSVA
jgi:hypothetical protein